MSVLTFPEPTTQSLYCCLLCLSQTLLLNWILSLVHRLLLTQVTIIRRDCVMNSGNVRILTMLCESCVTSHLYLLESLICLLNACSARSHGGGQTHRQTHRPSTVTLAAHVCRGLMKSTKVLNPWPYFMPTTLHPLACREI